MEWVETLQGHVVGLDTAPLVYFIEENSTYLQTVRPFFDALGQGQLRAVTSIVTLIEVLVHPLRRGDKALAERYRRILLDSEGLTTVVLSREIAEQAAEFRASYGLRTPDAIQLAAAVHEGASCFLTNDARLPSVPGLQILVLDDLVSRKR